MHMHFKELDHFKWNLFWLITKIKINWINRISLSTNFHLRICSSAGSLALYSASKVFGKIMVIRKKATRIPSSYANWEYFKKTYYLKWLKTFKKTMKMKKYRQWKWNRQRNQGVWDLQEWYGPHGALGGNLLTRCCYNKHKHKHKHTPNRQTNLNDMAPRMGIS